MHTNSSLLFLHTLTSTHAGSGTELSYIDLPIQRETHTGFPKIEASTLKGCLRANYPTSADNADALLQLFGTAEQDAHASAVAITDARLLFFPVKSGLGIFAWVSCPYVINRFLNDLALAGILSVSAMTQELPSGQAQVMPASALVNAKNKMMLEDYTFTVSYSQDDSDASSFSAILKIIAEHLPQTLTKDHFISHAALLSDDDFTTLAKYATEINTRIKINPQTGTVDNSALFTEEFLPPESILYSLAFYHAPYRPGKLADAGEVKEKFKSAFDNKCLQIGADATLGKGLVQIATWKEAEDNGQQRS